MDEQKKVFAENEVKDLIEQFFNNDIKIPFTQGCQYEFIYNSNVYNISLTLADPNSSNDDEEELECDSLMFWKYGGENTGFSLIFYIIDDQKLLEFNSPNSNIPEKDEYTGFKKVKKYLDRMITDYEKSYKRCIDSLYDYAKSYYLKFNNIEDLGDLRANIEEDFFLNKNTCLSYKVIDEIEIYNMIQLDEKNGIVEYCGCSFVPADTKEEKWGNIDPMIFVNVMRSLSDDIGIEFGNIDYSYYNDFGSFIMLDLKIEKPQKLAEIIEIIEGKKEQIHNVLYKAINNFLSNREICVKPYDNVTYWIVPSKRENLYNDGLQPGATFLWSAGKNKLGNEDVLYFYVTWPIKKIIAKGKIVENKIENGPDGEKWVLVQLVCFLNREELTSDILSKHGFAPPQGKQKLNNNPTLLKYIVDHEKPCLKNEIKNNYDNEHENIEIFDLIDNTDQILQNINAIDKCLGEMGTLRHNQALKIMQMGICFVVILKNGEFKFYPSKFIGYKNNSLEINEEFSNSDERDINTRITEILQQKFILNDKLDQEYVKYCQRCGIEPQNVEKRKYCFFDINN